MKGTRVMSANGRVIDDLPGDLAPTVAPAAAVDAAREIVEKYRASEARGARYAAPRLEIFNKSVLADGTYPSRLAWFVEATNLALREYIWIDAHTGANLLNFSQLPHAKSRQVYDMAGGERARLPGTLRRTEGRAAVGDADVDNAYALRRYHLRLLLRDPRARQLRRRRRRAHLVRALRDPGGLRERVLERNADGLRRRIRVGRRRRRPRADARRDRAHGQPALLLPVRRAERIDVGRVRRNDRHRDRQRQRRGRSPLARSARTCRSARSAT